MDSTPTKVRPYWAILFPLSLLMAGGWAGLYSPQRYQDMELSYLLIVTAMILFICAGASLSNLRRRLCFFVPVWVVFAAIPYRPVQYSYYRYSQTDLSLGWPAWFWGIMALAMLLSLEQLRREVTTTTLVVRRGIRKVQWLTVGAALCLIPGKEPIASAILTGFLVLAIGGFLGLCVVAVIQKPEEEPDELPSL